MIDQAIIRLLEESGPRTASDIAEIFGISVNTVSRLARENAQEIIKLGGSRSTQYAARQTIEGLPDEQPLFWVNEYGDAKPFATLNALRSGRIHLGSARWSKDFKQNEVPWLLACALQAGYLGRAIAHRFAEPPYFYDSNPERWSFMQQLFVALNPNVDLPGAILIGEAAVKSFNHSCAVPEAKPELYDEYARQARSPTRIGTSAGGEQPKFLAVRDDRHVLVKFSPPRGTPNGERWHDLLHCEAIAAQVLQAHEVPTAKNRIVETATRTYLESERIDRVMRCGRRHALPLWAIHGAFVSGSQQNWPRTAAALASQRRLSKEDAQLIALVFRFGTLIGNNDMHFGNLSLIAPTPEAAKNGQFQLAPIYDMLPMGYRPDNSAPDFAYTRFTPTPALPGDEVINAKAQEMAKLFWTMVAAAPVSNDMKKLASEPWL